ncbi:hypothetical protein N7G274_010377 [Stereocaulon virgatum]|uniref:Rhodopsin domain-containing protein n=1 Tax=Stereocaulon virgatum TaxID=373712 RepID=A0ABR3ZUL9_9LECA
MASLPPPPPGMDLKANQGPRVISSGIALIVLPTIFVILRFVSRFIAQAGFWWDDLLVVVSLLLSYGPNASMMHSARTNGFGKHLWALDDPPRNSSQFLKILYVYIIFYYAAVVTIKLCILTFYRRIFPVTEIRYWLYTGYALVGSYAIATLCATIFQCQPIHGFWDKTIPLHCTSGDNILIVPGGFNAVLDAFVVLLPLPFLWRLRTTHKQKGILTGIFACGGFVCVISIIRLIVLSRLYDADVTWNYVNAAIWSAAEPSMGVIAACIPSLRPLVAYSWRGIHKDPTILTKKSDQATTSSGSSRMMWPSRVHGEDLVGGFTRLEEGRLRRDQTQDRWGHDVNVRGGKSNRASNVEGNVSLEELNSHHTGIRVKNEVTVTSTAWNYKDKVF